MEKFNWKFYLFLYDDLKHFNKENAYEHYKNHGMYENRLADKDIYDNFDWEFYIFINNDLKHFTTKKDAFYIIGTMDVLKIDWLIEVCMRILIGNFIYIYMMILMI